MRHGSGIPCPHNKGFSITVKRAIDIDCLACKHILRTQPEIKGEFDKTDPNIIADKRRKKKALKKEQWRDPSIPYREKPTYMNKVPKCPKCKSKMARRVRRSDGARFWGCIQYPNCMGSKSMV